MDQVYVGGLIMNRFSESCAVAAILVSAVLGGCAQQPVTMTNYSYQPPEPLQTLRNGNEDVWRFTTSERSTLDIEKSKAPGTTSTRTCQSTHEAERLILTGIEAVAETR